MGKKDIQEATASEPLTIQEEYDMQQSWRKDPDKLTFISCLPLPPSSPHNGSGNSMHTKGDNVTVQKMEIDAPHMMLGDVNLFLKLQENDDHSVASGIPANTDTDSDDKADVLVGEVELMIAEVHQQRKGFGRASLICFLKYVVDHQREIVDEFLDAMTAETETSITTSTVAAATRRGFGYLVVRIGATNARSLALFESLGFNRVTEQPNFFGELELRRYGLDQETVEEWLRRYGLDRYQELEYD